MKNHDVQTAINTGSKIAVGLLVAIIILLIIYYILRKKHKLKIYSKLEQVIIGIGIVCILDCILTTLLNFIKLYL